MRKKTNYKVAEAVASVKATPRKWPLPVDLAKLASVLYAYHVGCVGARKGAATTAHRTTWGRYEREARKLVRLGAV